MNIYSAHGLALLMTQMLIVSYAHAADSRSELKIPEDFDVKPRGSIERVTYARVITELPGTFKRSEIEKSCKASRDVGATKASPIFEQGWDLASSAESLRFTNDRLSAIFTTRKLYDCDVSTTGGHRDMCACTYRTLTLRDVSIKKYGANTLETIELNVSQRTARHTILPGKLTNLNANSVTPFIAAFAPMVAGKDKMAGMDCVLRRQSLGPDTYKDHCVTEDSGPLIPPTLRNRSLGSATYKVDGGTTKKIAWDRTEEIAIDKSINAGVFDIPEGYVVKETKLPTKE